MDRIIELDWVQNQFKNLNSAFSNYSIIQSANDEYHHRGLFMLIKAQKPRKIMMNETEDFKG